MRNQRPRVPAAALLALSCLTGCSTTTFKVGMIVDPPTSAVFVNGTRVGQGARRVYDIDFGPHECVCVQATAAGYEPMRELLTRQQVIDQVEKYGDFKWYLKQEK